MAYTNADKQKALQVYLQVRTIAKTAELTGFKYNTVTNWFIKHKWKQKLDEHLKKLADNPITETDKSLEVMPKVVEDSLGLLGTLRDICIMEGIVKGCLEENPETNPDHLEKRGFKGFKPASFKECVWAMEKCWKARVAVAEQLKPKNSKTEEGEGKIPYVKMAMTIYAADQQEKEDQFNNPRVVVDVPNRQIEAGEDD